MSSQTTKTNKMLVVEVRLGEPLEVWLRRRYIVDGRSIKALATDLGVSTATVWHWILFFGLPRRKWLFREKEEAPTVVAETLGDG